MDWYVSILTLTAGVSLAAWFYLLFFRGFFWRCTERLDNHDSNSTGPERWPAVTAVVPARNEAGIIGFTITSLLGQDYPGRLRVILVDDESGDGTTEAAQCAADLHGLGGRLTIERAKSRPRGWVGKVWALDTGVRAAGERFPETEYFLFTDADILHSPGNLRKLVTKAESGGLSLISLMVRLSCERGFEGLLIPAFVYFFQLLYPFRWVNDQRRSTAAAAGGCVLIKRTSLERAGGLKKLKGELIDDCALARLIKKEGAIRLGLTDSEKSIRPYGGLSGVWDMVARTAYTQLGYSPLYLTGTIAGMMLLYLVPPVAALTLPLHGDTLAAACGLSAWAIMAASFLPTLSLYGGHFLIAPGLPLAGILYTAMTFDSALRHWRGAGAVWKERVGGGRIEKTGFH